MAVTRKEGTHVVEDGAELYTKTWTPSSEPKARMLFIHGFSDHCNNYADFFDRLAADGIQVHAYDGRGWGRSVKTPSQKGLSGPTSTVLSDITSVLRPLLPSTVPFFLMGHSMGGAQCLYYASRGPSSITSQIRGFISSAPLIALHPKSAPWKPTVVAGRVAAKLLPRMQMVNKLDEKWLSRDAAENKKFVDDPLCHDTGTLEGLAGMLDRGIELDSGKVVMEEGIGEGGVTRLLLVHGTGDHITYSEASRRFVERCQIRDKEFRPYEGWYHNLHVEPGENKLNYAKDIAKWILDRSSMDGTTSQSSQQSKL